MAYTVSWGQKYNKVLLYNKGSQSKFTGPNEFTW